MSLSHWAHMIRFNSQKLFASYLWGPVLWSEQKYNPCVFLENRTRLSALSPSSCAQGLGLWDPPDPLQKMFRVQACWTSKMHSHSVSLTVLLQTTEPLRATIHRWLQVRNCRDPVQHIVQHRQSWHLGELRNISLFNHWTFIFLWTYIFKDLLSDSTWSQPKTRGLCSREYNKFRKHVRWMQLITEDKTN